MASACSNVAAPKAGASTVDVSSSRKLTETGCTKKRSCVLQRKKPVNPLSVSVRPPKVDTVRQRVQSAKMLKIRHLQSQLNDANYHLIELAHENRALKSTQRRQDKALNNYEGVNANLPRLIQSHVEENRVLMERNKTLKRQLREVTDTLKIRDDELLSIKDHVKQLTALAKDKHLEERAQLRTSLMEAKELIRSQESEINLLNRRLTLEVKNCKYKMNAEAVKYRKCREELDQALVQAPIPGKPRLLSKRFKQSPDRRSSSNLKETSESENKLEPLKTRNQAERGSSVSASAEKTNARSTTRDGIPSKLDDFSNILEKLSIEEAHLKKSLQTGAKSSKLKPTKLESFLQQRKALYATEAEADALNTEVSPRTKPRTSRFEGTQRFKKVETEDDTNEEQVEIATNESPTQQPQQTDVDSIQENGMEEGSDDAEDIVRNHFKKLEAERELLRQQQQQENKASEQLEELNGSSKQTIRLKREDNELIDDVWDAEYTFGTVTKNGQFPLNGVHRMSTGNHGDPEVSPRKKDLGVALENKKRLLAALREIDNGNSLEQQNNNTIDNVHNNNNIESDNRKSRLMRELFG